VCKKKTLDEKRTEYRMKVKPGYYGYPKLEGGTATIQKEVGSSKEGGETRRTRGMDARGLMSESWRGEGRDSRSEEREPSYDDCNWSFYQATNPERPSPARYSQADLIPGQYYQLTILNNPNMAGVEDVIIRKTAAPGVQSYAGAYDRGCAQENELTIEEKNELEGRLIDFDGWAGQHRQLISRMVSWNAELWEEVEELGLGPGSSVDIPGMMFGEWAPQSGVLDHAWVLREEHGSGESVEKKIVTSERQRVHDNRVIHRVLNTLYA
jgi:hypothetical protein